MPIRELAKNPGMRHRDMTAFRPTVCAHCHETVLPGRMLYRVVGQADWYCSEAHANLGPAVEP